MTSQKSMNRDVPPQLSSGIHQKLEEIRHASLYATRFYGSRLCLRLDYPLRHCFHNLKKLHGNLKNVLSIELGKGHPRQQGKNRNPDSEAAEIALRYQSLSLLTPYPGPDLIDYVVATEHRQKRLQTGLLEELDDAPLKIAISAQTAMLQVTIDRMSTLIKRESHQK
ncbi:hypothetical protein [uncultured Microbulbifer sp.]|uniref:hypothetical protein n=1 Tax=uncultured Microbulbifer sp. TaxID=348147 RepID=UPI0026322D4D|nr:hypothetical protein [uncultured Microbulbifer sp.]